MPRHEHEDDENLRTMIAWRLSQSTARKWWDVFLLFAFMFVFLFGAGVIGAFQYYVLCKPKYPTATLEECLSFTLKPAPPAKGK